VVNNSTDNVMKSSEFDLLCSESVSEDTLPLVRQWLVRERLIAVKQTDLDYSVVKVCDHQGSSVSDVDISIVRCVLYNYSNCFTS